MKTGHKPAPPRCQLGKLSGSQMDVETVKAAGWRENGLLVVSVDDTRLNWVDQEFVRQLGVKLFGERLYGK